MHAVYCLVGTAVDTVYVVVYKDVNAVYCPIDRAIDAVCSLITRDIDAVYCLVDIVIDAAYKLVVVDTGAVYKMSSMPHACCSGAGLHRCCLSQVANEGSLACCSDTRSCTANANALQRYAKSSSLCRQSFAYFFGPSCVLAVILPRLKSEVIAVLQWAGSFNVSGGVHSMLH